MKALKVLGPHQTNNRGELAAVAWALAYAPKDTLLLIKSDSTYVINGFCSTHQAWEDQGWLGIENDDLWKLALQELRNRSVATRIAKVKAHSNIYGNEQADRLANEGRSEDPSDDLDIEVQEQWLPQGARLSKLSFNLTYRWVRHLARGSKPSGRANDSVQGGIALLKELYSLHVTPREVWRSLRTNPIRKSGFFPDGLGGYPRLEEIQTAGIPQTKNATANRLFTMIVTETAFAVWKVRNRERFDHVTLPTRAAIDILRKAIETRARKDLYREKLKGPKTAPDLKKERDIALAWSRIIALRAGVATWFPSDYG
ncbi:hypothetical protein FS837_003152 [Tulasnella sp. UAMH 9824]|nr:hypothetical protein FS837_003152 [Tulasnella sp. UAMH 9824]